VCLLLVEFIFTNKWIYITEWFRWFLHVPHYTVKTIFPILKKKRSQSGSELLLLTIQYPTKSIIRNRCSCIKIDANGLFVSSPLRIAHNFQNILIHSFSRCLRSAKGKSYALWEYSSVTMFRDFLQLQAYCVYLYATQYDHHVQKLPFKPCLQQDEIYC
jgi:hypothetical protein